MVRTNMTATRRKPETARVLTAHALRRERISQSFVRVTVGGGDLEEFVPMGFDQWFRLFLPVGEKSLARLPRRLDTLSYLRYLAIAKTERPLLRNYTVGGFRPDGTGGAELDIDFVLLGLDDGLRHDAGPAVEWALQCTPGDAIGLLDEGVSYNASPECGESTLLVADETGLPAVAGILSSLPDGARGVAVIEVPDASDRRDLHAPAGVEVRWIVRADPDAVPGRAALTAVQALAVPGERFYGWAVGEQSLAVGARRHWVRAGVPRSDITFCGYWRHGH
jgi:NADPH-dependent ferric siderophore reductase